MWMVHCICHITWSATVAVWLFVRLFAHWPASFPVMASTHNWSTSLCFHNITNGQLSIHIKIRAFMFVCVCVYAWSQWILLNCLSWRFFSQWLIPSIPQFIEDVLPQTDRMTDGWGRGAQSEWLWRTNYCYSEWAEFCDGSWAELGAKQTNHYCWAEKKI